MTIAGSGYDALRSFFRHSVKNKISPQMNEVRMHCADLVYAN